MPAVTGPSFEVAWRAPVDVRKLDAFGRRKYWAKALAFVLAEKDRDLNAGLDKDGNPLVPISDYTRKHRESAMAPPDPDAPPLTPAYGESRTRALLTGRADADGVVCWWLYDLNTKASWGVILGYHAAGSNRLPIRDVIGLSAEAVARARDATDRWWRTEGRQSDVPQEGFASVKREPVITYQFGGEHKEAKTRQDTGWQSAAEFRASRKTEGVRFGANGRIDWKSYFATKTPQGGFPRGPYRVGDARRAQ